MARDLLRDAVDVAATEQYLARRHSRDPAAGKQPLEALRGQPVGALIEQRHDDAAVGDVEVDIACGEPLARDTRPAAGAPRDAGGFARAHRQRSGHGEPGDLEAPSTGITRIVEGLPGAP